MESKKQVEIFWTGGFDSTFRMCQLSRMDVEVTPYYILNNRPSVQKEIDTVNSITEKLLGNPRTTATINPVKVISKPDCDAYKEFMASYNVISAKESIGRQYDFLGVFAIEHKGIELGIHDANHGGKAFFEKYSVLKPVEDESGRYYILDKEKTDPDFFTVFGLYHFPLLDFTKVQMMEEYKRMGLEEIMDQTWFCYTPIDGKPCGKCPPCCFAIENGMSFRFTPNALRNYVIYRDECRRKKAENEKNQTDSN